MTTVTDNPRHIDRKCPDCSTIYTGQNWRCNPCTAAYVKDLRAGVHRPVAHKGAYTHAIRDEKTKHIYKYSILDGNIPEGYSVIYKTEAGYLLPNIYKLMEPYKK